MDGMSPLEQALADNARFAATDSKTHVPRIPFLPTKQLYVLTCIDPRVDPGPLLGLALGDAIVARTVGGRANRAFLDDLAWISFLHETKTPDADWFDVLVIHHTDCGSAFMSDAELRRDFVERGFDDAVLRETAVVDPAVTVPVDVHRIRSNPVVSGHIRVAGYTYDVTTGRLTEVSSPSAREN